MPSVDASREAVPEPRGEGQGAMPVHGGAKGSGGPKGKRNGTVAARLKRLLFARLRARRESVSFTGTNASCRMANGAH